MKCIVVFELDNIKMNINIIRKSIEDLNVMGKGEVEAQKEMEFEAKKAPKNRCLEMAKQMEANFNRILQYGKSLPELESLES